MSSNLDLEYTQIDKIWQGKQCPKTGWGRIPLLYIFSPF
jgi:hypothetical protein